MIMPIIFKLHSYSFGVVHLFFPALVYERSIISAFSLFLFNLVTYIALDGRFSDFKVDSEPIYGTNLCRLVHQPEQCPFIHVKLFCCILSGQSFSLSVFTLIRVLSGFLMLFHIQRSNIFYLGN